MGVQFERLRLSGWKSIRELDLELRPLTVLVGGNGAGKSNLIGFLRLLPAMADGRLQLAFNAAGGPETLLHYGSKVTPRLVCELSFSIENSLIRYTAEWMVRRPEGLTFASEKVSAGDVVIFDAGSGRLESEVARLQEAGDPYLPRLPFRVWAYHFHDAGTAAGYRNACSLLQNRFLQSDGGNLAAMLYLYRERYPTSYRRVRAAVRAVFPDFDDFALEPLRLRPTDILLEWRQAGRDYVFGPHQLSDGTIRFMALAALLLQPDEDLPALILLDEPELGLHPAALGALAAMLKGMSARTRVLVATQSATLLDHFAPEDVVTVDRRDGASVFTRLDPERLKVWREGEFSLADLWERNVFGGGPY